MSRGRRVLVVSEGAGPVRSSGDARDSRVAASAPYRGRRHRRGSNGVERKQNANSDNTARAVERAAKVTQSDSGKQKSKASKDPISSGALDAEMDAYMNRAAKVDVPVVAIEAVPALSEGADVSLAAGDETTPQDGASAVSAA